jgi:hypothetical protein
MLNRSYRERTSVRLRKTSPGKAAVASRTSSHVIGYSNAVPPSSSASSAAHDAPSAAAKCDIVAWFHCEAHSGSRHDDFVIMRSHCSRRRRLARSLEEIGRSRAAWRDPGRDPRGGEGGIWRGIREDEPTVPDTSARPGRDARHVCRVAMLPVWTSPGSLS